MKKLSRVLCMILAVIMIIGIMPKVEAQAATTPAKVTEEQVKQRMEVFKKMVDDGAYFTYDGTPCAYASGHGCNDCSTDRLIKSDHIKNYLGLLPESIYRLPNKYGRSCMSCKAFVLIAHWYLYAQKSTDDVAVNIVNGLNEVKFSSSNMLDSNGNPKFRIGDILESDSQNHSLIISDYYKENGKIVGFYTIDCNWNGKNVGNCKVQERKYTFSGFSNVFGATTVYRATNYSAHVHDYSGNNNIGYCNSCKNDYLTTSEFSSSKVYTSGTVTPKTTAQLHIKMRPYAASTWTNGDANIKADSATMEYTCKNHWGNTWYCVKFKDSSGSYKTGYVYNGDVNFVKDPNTVNASCFLASKFGGKINEGDSLWVSKSEYGGSVKSTDGTTWITKVVFGIYNTNGSLTSSKNEVTKRNINATSYTISSSDDTILFSSLSQGNYVFKITGYDVTGKSGSASFNFTVVKSGATTYTISYNANGGSGAPSSQTKIKDTTLTLSTQKPTRGGYTFLGWATSSSATSAQYQPGGSYTSNSSVTLYAVWKAQTYTVSYNANGGSGAPSSQTKIKDTTLTLSTQKPTRSGYTFLGWATSSSATSAQYQPGGSYTNNASVTLYAVWRAQTYTISYDANGGSGAPSNQTKTHGVNLILSSTVPYKSGYEFKGWQAPSIQGTNGWVTTKPSSGSYETGYKYYIYGYECDHCRDYGYDYDVDYTFYVGYDKNEVISTVKDNPSVYGSYTPSKLRRFWLIETSYKGADYYPGQVGSTYNYFTADFVAEDGKTGRASIYKTHFYFESNVYRQSSSTGKIYQPGATYTVDESVKLTAIWKEAAKYTISYNANGGYGAPAAQTKTHDVTLKLSTQQPTRDGYTFLGWATSSSATSAQYQPGGSYASNANATLYAVWKVQTYTITYDNNGGRWIFDFNNDEDENGQIKKTAKVGESIELCSNGASPVRDDCLQWGWSTTKMSPYDSWYSGMSEPEYWYNEIYSENEDITLYAIWIESYSVRHDINGGTYYFNGETYKVGHIVEKYKGCATTIAEEMSNIKRDGYTFLGWSTNPNATTAQYQSGDVYNKNVDIDLYAVWQKNAPVTYTVSYNANGGSGAPAAQTKTHDVALKLSTQQPTRDGYTFLGWATNSSATSAQYQPGGSYTNNAGVTLYAVWQKQNTNAPTITVATVNGSAGKEVTVGISIENNPGINGLSFKINYDKSKLSLTGYEDGTLSGWIVGVGAGEKAVWSNTSNSSVKGEVLKLKFTVLDSADEGTAKVEIIDLMACNDEDREIEFNIISGCVNIKNRLPGDVNGDGKVNIFDVTRLERYLAGFNVEINENNANINGDGKVNLFDLTRLKRYLAGFDVELV